MKILILGHNGLLGNMVYKYFKSKSYQVITTNLRWPTEEFKFLVKDQQFDFIINCIANIGGNQKSKGLIIVSIECKKCSKLTYFKP